MSADARPFSGVLRWALLLPLAFFAAAYGVGGTLHAVPLFLAAGALLELLAVSVAIFLLAKGSRYRTAGNFLLTLVAAIPLALILAVAFSLGFGHVHL